MYATLHFELMGTAQNDVNKTRITTSTQMSDPNLHYNSRARRAASGRRRKMAPPEFHRSNRSQSQQRLRARTVTTMSSEKRNPELRTPSDRRLLAKGAWPHSGFGRRTPRLRQQRQDKKIGEASMCRRLSLRFAPQTLRSGERHCSAYTSDGGTLAPAL